MENQNSMQPQTMIVIPQFVWQQQTEMLQRLNEKIDRIDFDKVLSPKEYMSVNEFCKSYSMSRAQFEVHKRDGKFASYKVGGKIYVKRAEIELVFQNSKQ